MSKPALEYRPETSIDGIRIRPGAEFFCRARMANPHTRVVVVRQHRVTRSWLDGRLVVLWEVRAPERELAYVVEPWMLSSRPIREVLEHLRKQA